VTILLALGGLLISGLVGYSSDANAMTQRIRALEVQQENDKYRLERIEIKLDRLYEYTTGRKP
jgi:hypothetical protein